MKLSAKWAVFGASLVACAAAFVGGRAWASGVPAKGALTYAGTLEDADGNAALQTGEHNVVVQFFSVATDGKPACDSGKPQTLMLDKRGRFSVALPDDCATVVGANPDLWSEVLVDGASLGRSKIGAVPYALEAARASDATGALDTRISDIETRLGPRSTVRAHLTATQSIADQSPIATVKLAAEDLDENAEFDPTTFTFSPKVAGNYFLQCTVRFETVAPGTNGWFDASILVKGDAIQRDGFYGDGWTSARDANGVFNLAKGALVTCGANQQDSGAARNVTQATFTAFRLGPAD